MTFSGTISDILYTSPQFSVVEFHPHGQRETFTAVGDLSGFNKSDAAEITGEWTAHPEYGMQFKVQVAVRPIPSTAAAIERFLCHHVHGCGPKLARRIVQATGDDQVLRESPDTLLAVKGVKAAMLQAIRAAWEANALEKQVSLFLAKYEVGLGWTSRIAAHFGPCAISALTRNPYRFIEIDGIGFKKADEIAFRMGWKKDSPERAEAILIYLMEKARDEGDVYLFEGDLLSKMHASGVPPAISAAALAAQTGHRRIRRVRAAGANGSAAPLVYLPEMLEYEQALAKAVDERLASGATVFGAVLSTMIREAEAELEVELTGAQRQAVVNAFERGLSIVTGGPGTGKSTLVKVLTRVAWRVDQRVVLTAPTGRAAKNLSAITGHPGSTIHALLEYNPAEEGWRRDRHNPIEGDLVVIDEGSMMELEVAHRLFDAIPLAANVLVIGDDNQLPSVGPGRVLNDLIECGRIPIVRLDRVHRQAARSQIVANARRVLEGKPPAFAPADTEGHPTDCHLLKPPPNLTENTARIQWARETLVDIVRRRLPARYGINPMRDIQVLSPMRKGELGVNELNTLLQQALNPKTPHTSEIMLAGRLLRTGDRILCNKNNPAVGVVNGDVGTLAAIDHAAKALVLDIGGKEMRLPFEQADQASLAYVLTVHKAQGAEYPFVIALFFNQHFTMLQRNLLYTAMTRAKQRLVFLALPQALEIAARTIETTRRNTLLAQRIRVLGRRKAA